MAQLLKGRVLAARIEKKVKIMVASLPSQPGMAAILVGDDPASHLYVSMKEKMCLKLGIHFEKFVYPANEPEANLIAKINELNDRIEIDGILVQVPLPTQNVDAVIAAIHPNKDIDGFHAESLRRLEAGEPGLVAPVALGIMKLIDEAHGSPKTAALVCSDFFASPLIALLKEIGVETIKETPQADIIIVAIGKPKSIKADQVKQGAIVIDVGTTKTAEGLFGDVDFDLVEPIAGAITPVPGGVGPMTVAMLMMNVVKGYRLNHPKVSQI